LTTPDILGSMITGAHFLFYSKNPEADRTFFRDVLGFCSIDVGEGWLIFAMPPAEAGIHPLEGESSHRQAEQGLLGAVLYLMCDDLQASMAALQQKNIQCSEVEQAGWGKVTTIPMPSGGKIGLYEPRHPAAFHLAK